MKMLTVMISSGALLSFQGAQACKAMNEAWRGSQRMFFRTGGAAGKAEQAQACGKAHLLHRGVEELLLLFMGW